MYAFNITIKGMGENAGEAYFDAVRKIAKDPGEPPNPVFGIEESDCFDCMYEKFYDIALSKKIGPVTDRIFGYYSHFIGLSAFSKVADGVIEFTKEEREFLNQFQHRLTMRIFGQDSFTLEDILGSLGDESEKD